MNPIAQACAAHGLYVVSASKHPGQVLERALEALRILAPEVHAVLTSDPTALGATAIPAGALGDQRHAWWSTDACFEFVTHIMLLLDVNAPAGFRFRAQECFGFFPDDGQPSPDSARFTRASGLRKRVP